MKKVKDLEEWKRGTDVNEDNTYKRLAELEEWKARYIKELGHNPDTRLEDVGPYTKGIVMDRVRELERKTKDLEEWQGMFILSTNKRIAKLEEWKRQSTWHNPEFVQTDIIIDKKVWEDIKSDIHLMAEYLEKSYWNTPMATIARNLLLHIKKAECSND
jgi:hypothetical protein